MNSDSINDGNIKNHSKKLIHRLPYHENDCRQHIITNWINDGNNNIDSNDYISINDIRQLYGFNQEEQPIEWETFYNFYKKNNHFYGKDFIKILYFHYLLIIGNYICLHKFIVDFINSSSIDNFEKFVNYPLYIPIHKINNKKYYNDEIFINKIYHLYPITTCMMWNNKPELVRLLVSFGAVLHQSDNLGYYPEEAIKHIPYFNPINYLENFERYYIIKERKSNEKIYYRKIEEFKNVINEARYIAGEDISYNWFYPI